MSLEILNTAASLATVAVVAGTAIAAVIQLKHLALREVRWLIAVGIRVAAYPPHRSRRAEFPHRAPTAGVERQTDRSATGAKLALVAAKCER